MKPPAPAPVAILNEIANSEILLICEHAGNLIPPHLGNLGLDADSLVSHIAWDIGAEGLARELSNRLDAPLVLQRYSRLVYDCNRPQQAEGAIPEISEYTTIPGNQGISTAERTWRFREIYSPFHKAVEDRIDVSIENEFSPVIITIHSFTSTYKGAARDTDLGLLYNVDDRLAKRMLAQRECFSGRRVELNQPYGPADGVMHTLIQHAEARSLPGVMIEICNDHIKTTAEQLKWAGLLARFIRNSIVHDET